MLTQRHTIKLSRAAVCWLGFVSLALSLIVSCDFSGPWDYSAPAEIEFTITGGIVGIHTQTRIDATGLAELTHYYFQKYVVHYQLNSSQLDSLKSAFDRAHFVTLKDRYPQKHPIKDAFSYSISYSVDDVTKTVVIEEGADYPEKLQPLLHELHKVSGLILDNPDAGTLLIYQTYTIKIWPFSDSIKLGDHAGGRVYFNNTELDRQIFTFLNQMDLQERVFWEGDFLYVLGLRREGPTFEDNIGSYFQVRGVPVRYWPAEFGFRLSQIPETGLVIDPELYQAVRRLLQAYQVYPQLFILDELKENGKAVSLLLLSGKPQS